MIERTLQIESGDILSDVNHTIWAAEKKRITGNNLRDISNKTIEKDKVIYDVNFTTWKIAKVRLFDNEQAQFEAQTDGENSKWFDRYFEWAMSDIASELSPFITYSSESNGYDLSFHFSDVWNGSSARLANYIHHYIVDYILYEWFKMTMPNESATYLASAETWKTKAIEEAHKEDSSLGWFTVQCQSAMRHIAGRLKWCNTFNDDTYQFSFSDNWRGNFDALSNYIHHYIVDYILYEWFKMTIPNEAATYLASATEWESKIINEARSEDVRNVYFRL